MNRISFGRTTLPFNVLLGQFAQCNRGHIPDGRNGRHVTNKHKIGELARFCSVNERYFNRTSDLAAENEPVEPPLSGRTSSLYT